MCRHSIVLTLFFLLTMQTMSAMNGTGQNGLKAPKPVPATSILSWLFSSGSTQEVKEVDEKERDTSGSPLLELLAPIPGKEEIPERVQLNEDASPKPKRPPTPFYEYPGGPPIDTSDCSDRCGLKISLGSSTNWCP